jgi:hypothetical protein
MAAKNPTGEPDPTPFKIHLMTRAGRVMRVRSGPVRAFSTKEEAVRFAGRQLGGDYAVYHNHRKIWPAEQNPGSDLSTRPAPTATPEQPAVQQQQQIQPDGEKEKE